MRTLQRLKHSQYPDDGEALRMYQAEVQAVDKKERFLWVRRLRVAGTFVLLGGTAAWLLFQFLAMHTVVDALVPSNAVVVRAPATVRVAEILGIPGKPCRQGEPLLRLESTSGDEERAALALAAESARLRLELVQAGGEIESMDLARRTELIAQADREAESAEAAYWVTVAAHEGLIEKRIGLTSLLARESAARQGQIAAVEERKSAAQATYRRARVQMEQTARETAVAERLGSSGTVAANEVDAARSALVAAELEADSRAAGLRVLELELASARSEHALAEQRAESRVRELDAEIKAGERSLESALLQAQRWRTLRDKRGELFPAAVDSGDLSSLELDILRAEWAQAQARLDALEQRLGNQMVLAHSDGVVDQLFVEVGAVVDADAPLLSYFDPDALGVVAYATPRAAARLRLGSPCQVFIEGDDEPIRARVVSIGRSWVLRPGTLPARDTPAADFRRPIRIECSLQDRRARLHPNMRLKVVFRSMPKGKG